MQYIETKFMFVTLNCVNSSAKMWLGITILLLSVLMNRRNLMFKGAERMSRKMIIRVFSQDNQLH